MERIKNIVVLCVYISLTVLVLSFVPNIFPQSESSLHAYTHMQEQFRKITESSSVDTDAMTNLISEEEFNNGLSAETVNERMNTLLMETHNYEYIYGEDALTQIADQVQAIYEAEQDIAKDTQRSAVLQQVRIASGVVFGLSIAIIGLILYMQKNKEKKK